MDFMQTIIGMYLCPGSRAEKAEKITGGKKEKEKSRIKVFMQTIIGMYLCPVSLAEKQKR